MSKLIHEARLTSLCLWTLNELELGQLPSISPELQFGLAAGPLLLLMHACQHQLASNGSSILISVYLWHRQPFSSLQPLSDIGVPLSGASEHPTSTSHREPISLVVAVSSLHLAPPFAS